MAKILEAWKVLPHSELSRVADNILTVVGEIEMPLMTLPRRMTVVRLRDDRLVIFSAIALDEPAMRTLVDFGDPAYLIVPNDHHRMDAGIWKARYPAMLVIAPDGARDKIAEAVPVDATTVDFDDPAVRLVVVPGTQDRELALEVSGSDGLTLILNDIVAHIQDAKGFGGWLLGLMGFAGDDPHVPAPVKMAIVSDKAALRDQFLRWAADPALRRVLVSHGTTIDGKPRDALRKLADTLA